MNLDEPVQGVNVELYGCTMKAHIISASFYKRWATIAAFTQECHEVSKSKGWLEKPCTHAQIANLMVSELSEALEDYRVAVDLLRADCVQ